ncbi:hypothetical protein Vafri_13793 [Volvox africanus]|uniref:Uncharacterized protein n=1 Tax=Volvox africanus TaxID=51714 RepID=A0A8J4BHJ7_9CHLO|nr:hypothetical protein Vafri_13793 [Volvox africanus]
MSLIFSSSCIYQSHGASTVSSQRRVLHSPWRISKNQGQSFLEGLWSSSSWTVASCRGASQLCCAASPHRQEGLKDPASLLRAQHQPPLRPQPQLVLAQAHAREESGGCGCGRGCSCENDRSSVAAETTRMAGGRRWLIPQGGLIASAPASLLCATVAAAQEGQDSATVVTAASASSGMDLTAAELAAAGVTTVVPAGYVPSPLEPGWEVWLGFVAGVVPFAIGAYEFGKRIIIQLRCEQCGGRGLVPSAGPGRDKYLRKCPQCGGFFPWISWKMFLTSTAAPGNGGPLQQPRGQTSVFYSVPEKPDPAKQAEALSRSQATIDAITERGPKTLSPSPSPSQEQGSGGAVSEAAPGVGSAADVKAGHLSADGGVAEARNLPGNTPN